MIVREYWEKIQDVPLSQVFFLVFITLITRPNVSHFGAGLFDGKTIKI